METTDKTLSEQAHMFGITRKDLMSMKDHLSESVNVSSFIDQFCLERPEISISENCNFATITGSTGRKVLTSLEKDISGDFRNFILGR